MAALIFCDRVRNGAGPERRQTVICHANQTLNPLEETAMSLPEISELARALIPTVHKAGQCIMSHFGRADVEYKDDHSPVTVADREADAIIINRLSELAPDIPVISEESSPTRKIGSSDSFFLVDPLDGTKEFINGRDEFTVNIALIERGAPRFGIVYAPAISKLYVTLNQDHAVMALMDPDQAVPAFDALDLEPIKTRKPDASGLVAAVSRSHLNAETEDFLKKHRISQTFTSGSSLKFCCLAEGLADVYPRFGRTMEWDTAAGHAVLGAAGGAVLDETGAPLRYGKIGDAYANPCFIAWGRV